MEMAGAFDCPSRASKSDGSPLVIEHMFDYTNSPMSVADLQSLLQRRWHGAAVHGRAAGVTGWPTGIASLDRALGPVGIPSGRLTEIFGAPSSGKTTLAYAVLAACTQRGDIGAYVDPQHGLFAPAALAAGIVLERLLIVRPTQTQALRRAVDAIVRSGACAVVVLDGTSADTLQTHHCARLVAQAERNNTALIALSRGESQPLASFASLRLRMRSLAPLWQSGSEGGDRLCGYGIELNVVKSRLGAPGMSAEFAASMYDVAMSWPDAHHDAAARAGTGAPHDKQTQGEEDACNATIA